MSEELKPCQTCGKIPEIAKHGTLSNTGVICADVECPMHYRGFMTLEAWNTRHIEDKLSQRITELEAQLLIAMHGQCSYCNHQQVSISDDPCFKCVYNPNIYLTDVTHDNWEKRDE